MRYRRSGVGVAVLQGLLFAIGGYLEGKTSTDAVECYNPRTKRYMAFACVHVCVVFVWERYNHLLSTLAASEMHHAQTVSDVIIHFYLSLSLSLTHLRWAPVAHMITPRMNLGVGAIKDMRDAVTGVTFNAIYAIGGYSGKSILGTAEKYEIQTDTWSEIAPMKTPRRNVGQ